MHRLIEATPPSPACETIDVLHGVSIADPYRWLEEQHSPATREWLKAQTAYARAYLDDIPGRATICERVHQCLAIETIDSVQKSGNRYFFRKRLPNEEQACIYMREGFEGEDQLLVNPIELGSGTFTSVKPLFISNDQRLLLFAIREGGERPARFAILDIERCSILPDILPRGYLRGFAFAAGNGGFYYVHEDQASSRPFYRAAHYHLFGTPFREDQEIFSAGEDEKIRLTLSANERDLAFTVHRFLATTTTDVHLKSLDVDDPPKEILRNISGYFRLRLARNKLLALTDRDAPNRRIVEVRPQEGRVPDWVDVVPEGDVRITTWVVAGNRMYVSYARASAQRILIFDLAGEKTGEIAVQKGESVRIASVAPDGEELFLEAESFTEPVRIYRCPRDKPGRILFASRKIPFDSEAYSHAELSYTSADGTPIPLILMGRREALLNGLRPVIMTAYGGFGISAAPGFSVLVALLLERGCLFALPSIRGGSEFGTAWHQAATGIHRQTAYTDFISAAEWLIKTGRTKPQKLAIFGGSNAGLLVGAALTQRPELFRAVVCLSPLLDMLRYHLFDNAHPWREEFGTVENHEEFAALEKYSPYHQVKSGVAYPASLFVSGDADRVCNSLHARKMTARLQQANASIYPVLLDYSEHRGHAPMLPLGERIRALTDRVAFLSEALDLIP
jgi:prolyl oligopeptidase